MSGHQVVVTTDGTRAGTQVHQTQDHGNGLTRTAFLPTVEDVQVHAPNSVGRRAVTVKFRDGQFVWTGAGEAPGEWTPPSSRGGRMVAEPELSRREAAVVALANARVAVRELLREEETVGVSLLAESQVRGALANLNRISLG